MKHDAALLARQRKSFLMEKRAVGPPVLAAAMLLLQFGTSPCAAQSTPLAPAATNPAPRAGSGLAAGDSACRQRFDREAGQPPVAGFPAVVGVPRRSSAL